MRKARFNLDENEVKPYLQLDKMVEAMFWAAGQVYRLEFKKLTDVPVYHPDMTVYDVQRDGKRVGLFYFDPYARAGKPARIVAKMNSLLEPEIIEALYEASQAGVEIDLIVRGVCARSSLASLSCTRPARRTCIACTAACEEPGKT